MLDFEERRDSRPAGLEIKITSRIDSVCFFGSPSKEGQLIDPRQRETIAMRRIKDVLNKDE